VAPTTQRNSRTEALVCQHAVSPVKTELRRHALTSSGAEVHRLTLRSADAAA
jgi:hypothetical protein